MADVLRHYQDSILGSQYIRIYDDSDPYNYIISDKSTEDNIIVIAYHPAKIIEINISDLPPTNFVPPIQKAKEAIDKASEALRKINRTTSLSAEELNQATKSLRTGLAEFMGDNNPIKHTKFEDNPFNENLIKRKGNNRT